VVWTFLPPSPESILKKPTKRGFQSGIPVTVDLRLHLYFLALAASDFLRPRSAHFSEQYLCRPSPRNGVPQISQGFAPAAGGGAGSFLPVSIASSPGFSGKTEFVKYRQ
jgi:hypothetical protein